MKLFWSGQSPFARKVTIAIHELGLQDRVEYVPANVVTGQNIEWLLRHNPLRKIPTLITDKGLAIYDSVVIIEYLDSLAVRPLSLFKQGEERWRDLSRQALGDGMLDILLLWRAEFRRPPEARQENITDVYATRIRSALDTLERAVPESSPAAVGPGDIAIGCALSYLDFRHDIDWRADRPELRRWYDELSQRPSFRATEFADR